MIQTKLALWKKIIFLLPAMLLSACTTSIQTEDHYENPISDSAVIAFLDDGVTDEQKNLFDHIITVDAHGTPGQHGKFVYNTFMQSIHNYQTITTLIAIDVVGENSQVLPENLAQGIELAQQYGARFLNVSISFPDNFTVIHEAVKHAHEAGITIFASTANDVFDRESYPAHYPEVYGVTLLDNDGDPADLATTKSSDIGIYTDLIPNSELLGTSLATPVALACT
ncbi:MAG: hypothetical protein J6M18_06895 [Actinomycetaceae bacterium]|nr:hypothetical protein [Actinomycetaceae bacterium]